MGKLRLSFCSVWEPQPLPHWAESAQTVEKYTTPNLRVRILWGQAGTPASLRPEIAFQTDHPLAGWVGPGCQGVLLELHVSPSR